MKATKYTLNIEIEVLSLDSVPGLLHEVTSHLESEVQSGILVFEDGDSVQWKTKSTNVEF
jgi:hypothetical protein